MNIGFKLIVNVVTRPAWATQRSHDSCNKICNKLTLSTRTSRRDSDLENWEKRFIYKSSTLVHAPISEITWTYTATDPFRGECFLAKYFSKSFNGVQPKILFQLTDFTMNFGWIFVFWLLKSGLLANTTHWRQVSKLPSKDRRCSTRRFTLRHDCITF